MGYFSFFSFINVGCQLINQRERSLHDVHSNDLQTEKIR